jgi:hypothetical protein
MPGAMGKARILRITRFTVMATLQAARARVLGLSEDSAYSWGLNRAIFYAAAKRGFSGTAPARSTGEAGRPAKSDQNLYSLGDDQAYQDPKAPDLRFTIGGETQTPDDFRKQVVSRFGGAQNFDRAWKEALAIVEGFDKDVLRSPKEFYSAVYKPRRDALVAKWSGEFPSPGPARSTR